jgi:hypothetical protein
MLQAGSANHACDAAVHAMMLRQTVLMLQQTAPSMHGAAAMPEMPQCMPWCCS